MTTNAKTPESIRGNIGQGLYGLGELRLYIAFDGDRRDAERTLYWLTQVLNPVGHEPQHADYSFTDLVSLFVVRELRKKGVKRRRIREAESHFRKVLGVDRPFACEEITTDGFDVYGPGGEAAPGMPSQLEAATRGGQHVFREPIKDLLHTIRYSDGAAAAWAPMPGVVLNPEIQFGAPVVEGTRVHTDLAADVVRNLGMDEAHARWPHAEPAAIEQALEFERRLAALRN